MLNTMGQSRQRPQLSLKLPARPMWEIFLLMKNIARLHSDGWILFFGFVAHLKKGSIFFFFTI